MCIIIFNFVVNYYAMSQFVIYLNLPKYLSAWLRNKLGSPVVFPPSSPQNAIIRAFISRAPKVYTPVIPEGDATPVAIPDSAAKPPEVYNYMSERGKAAVAEACKDLFLRALWSDMSPLAESPVGLNLLIAAWCETNGIDVDSIEAVRQCYYRIRKDYARKGINLRSRKKKS